MTANPDNGDALLIVDPQLDFCPGGALPVEGGDDIFPAVNRAAANLPLTVVSRDWHPWNHCSFEENGGPWPPHCRMGTPEAGFHPALHHGYIQKVVSKGSDPAKDAYSAFEDTGLAEWLREQHVTRLYVAGLATDYCVRASVLDAVREGFQVVVLEDAIGAVEAEEGDGERAIEEMRAAGATIGKSTDLEPESAEEEPEEHTEGPAGDDE
jgi:nicotinamidase/pyrazinamidase